MRVVGHDVGAYAFTLIQDNCGSRLR
jgi:hypothetical protein